MLSQMDELTHIYPLFTPTVQLHLIRSVVAVAFAGIRDRNKRDDRTQNVSYIENKSIDVDALETKGMDVLEGT